MFALLDSKATPAWPGSWVADHKAAQTWPESWAADHKTLQLTVKRMNIKDYWVFKVIESEQMYASGWEKWREWTKRDTLTTQMYTGFVLALRTVCVSTRSYCLTVSLWVFDLSIPTVVLDFDIYLIHTHTWQMDSWNPDMVYKRGSPQFNAALPDICRYDWYV